MNLADKPVEFRLTALGQAGFSFEFENTTLVIDPYLSDYVEQVEGRRSRRQYPIPLPPETLGGADWVLITHEHIDHCDPVTLAALSEASSGTKFVGPYTVIEILENLGIDPGRLVPAPDDWLSLSDGLRIRAVPAAHPELERDAGRGLRYVGYLVDYQGFSIYHSGDTSLNGEIMDALDEVRDVDLGLIAVNERNFFKEQQGIIGNMTLREAFGLAERLKVRTLVPTHWDMFFANSVFPEEITLLYDKLSPGFRLQLMRPGETAVMVAANVG